jgi:hypothetical protein
VRDCASHPAFNEPGPDRRRPTNPVRSKEAAVRGVLRVRQGRLGRSQVARESRAGRFESLVHGQDAGRKEIDPLVVVVTARCEGIYVPEVPGRTVKKSRRWTKRL